MISADVILRNKKAIFASGVLLLVFVIYSGLILYNKSLIREQKAIDTKLTALRESRDEEKENVVVEFDAKLQSLSKILDGHIFSSRIFPYIESLTHQKVHFTNFSFSSSDGAVTLNGVTQNYTTFGEQIVAFEKSGNIKNLVISNVKLEKQGQVEFVVAFVIDKEVYK